MFDNVDFTHFWFDNDWARQNCIEEKPSDALIAEIEMELGYKLPASYIWLMQQHNGGIPVNTVFPASAAVDDVSGDIWIADIMGIGRTKTWSLCGELGSRFMIDEWGYPALGVAICNCPSAGHDMIFLDYRACGTQGEPKVVHIDQENDYRITTLANTFEEFITGLVAEDPPCPPVKEKQRLRPFHRLFQKMK